MGTGLFPDAVLTINCDEEISIKPSFKKSRNFAKKNYSSFNAYILNWIIF